MSAGDATGSLAIRLFGPFDVQVEGKPLPRLRSRKGQGLLALLVLRHGRQVERSWLAGVLWPESQESQSMANLRLSLTDLRKALGKEANRFYAPTSRTLSFDLTGAWADVTAFDAAVVQGDAAAFEEAVRLYRGPLLEGCAEEWVFQERALREQTYLTVLETLADHALNRRDATQAIHTLQKVVAIAPGRERAQCQLMEALAMNGDTAALLQCYRVFRLYLHAEFQTMPSEETVALYRRLHQQATKDRSCAPSDTRMARPSHFLAPPALPCPLTPLIGREQAIGEVTGYLNTTRLVTLTGTGGIGKTRLALAIGETVVDDYIDGVFCVDLASLSDPALIVQTVAVAFQVTEASPQTLLETLLSALSPGNLLLILDNCEHLREACAAFAEAVLLRCPALKILTTSRQPLNLPGERQWRVPSLDIPPRTASLPLDKNLVSTLMEYSAVQLFVEQAIWSGTVFPLTAPNLEAVAQICRLLDGIPMAIELATARTRVLPVQQIAARLKDSFALLVGESTGVLPRHQTLWATLDWSCNLLSEAAKTLLWRLSVFAEGCTLEAAEEVCSGDVETRNGSSNTLTIPSQTVLGLLSALVDTSLIVFNEQPDGTGRYRLLETTRQYAGEKLKETGGEAAIRERHQIFFVAFAEEAEPLLMGSEQGMWLDRLEREHDNLRTALEWGNKEAALCLAGALWRFWQFRGYYSEGRKWLTGVLSAANGQVRTPAWVKALYGVGELTRSQSNFAAAQTLLQECLALYQASGDKKGITSSLDSLSMIAFAQGDYAVARRRCEESLTIQGELEDKQGVAGSFLSLGNIVTMQGDDDTARSLFEQSLALYQELENKQGIAYALLNLGDVAKNQGDYATAHGMYAQSLAILREVGHKQGIAYSLQNVGNIAHEQGDYAAAHTLQEESLTILRELGDKQGIAYSLLNLGAVARNQGDYATAHRMYAQSLAIQRELGNKYGIAASLNSLGDVAHEQGDDDTARPLFEQSLALYQELDIKQGIAYSLLNLGAVARNQGDYATAHGMYAQSLAILREVGHKQGIALSLVGLGDVARNQGDYAAARTLQEESLIILRELGDKHGIAASLEAFAGLASAQEQAQRASCLWGAAEALREALHAPLPPSERPLYDCMVTEARTALSQNAFATAWSEGRVLPVEQAIEYALSKLVFR